MNIIMNTTRIVSIDDIEKFLQGTEKLDLSLVSRSQKYHFISETLVGFHYNQLRKRDKTLVKKYIIKVTGYSPKHYKRLLKKWKNGILFTGVTPKISEKYLIPLLNDLLDQFPFRIINFHSDNGSEYINYQVASMLERIMVKQTKSRSRKTNDQALVEGKNGSVIRKHMGRNHIPRKYASAIDLFYKRSFNHFINYHRVCGYATDHVDHRGKVKKRYDTYMTPYERLKTLAHADQYLRDNASFEKLDRIAYAQSDITCAQEMQKAKEKIFKK